MKPVVRHLAVVTAVCAVLAGSAGAAAASAGGAARSTKPAYYVRDNTPYFRHHAFPGLKNITSFAVDRDGAMHAVALTESSGPRFIGHQPGRPFVMSEIHGPTDDAVFSSVAGPAVTMIPTAGDRSSYLLAVGCNGIYGVPVPTGSTRAPDITDADMLMPLDGCGALSYSEFFLDQAAISSGGRIVILANYGHDVITGTIGQPLTDTDVTTTDPHGDTVYATILGVDDRSGDAYLGGTYSNLRNGTVAVIWQFDAAADAWHGPTKLATFPSKLSVGVASVAARDGKVAVSIEQQTIADHTFSSSHVAVDIRNPQQRWSGFVRISHTRRTLGSVIQYEPGDGELRVMMTRYIGKRGNPEDLDVLRCSAPTRCSMPTTVVHAMPTTGHVGTEIGTSLLQTLPKQKFAYSYKDIQYTHVKPAAPARGAAAYSAP